MLSPEGSSVNKRIKESWCSLSYAMANDAAHRITAYDRGTLLIKLDIKNAYRVVQIHPADDRWLMGMIWEGLLFIDMTLPFGLCSVPKIFTALANAGEWIVRQQEWNSSFTILMISWS